MVQTTSKSHNLLRNFLKRLQRHGSVHSFFDRVVDHVPPGEIAKVLDRTSDPHTQIVLSNILRKQKDTRVARALRRLLQTTPNSRVRSAAAEALGDLRAASAGQELLKLLRDKRQPKYVRDTSALSLGLTGYRLAEKELIRQLSSRERTLRSCSAKALGLLHSRAAALPLTRQWLKEKDKSVKAVIRDSLIAIITK